MPAYGGHVARLDAMMPSTLQPFTPIYRSNMALILLTELVLSDAHDADWTAHLPLMCAHCVIDCLIY